MRFYSQFLKAGDLCFDIGAHVGDRTDVFISLGAKVVSIEPQASCVKALHKRFKRTQLVIIVPKAVGDNAGYSELVVCEAHPAISTMSDKWMKETRFHEYYESARIEKIPVTTLDDLIDEFGCPQFCKIDVEGYERNILKGLTRIIPSLSFEFMRECLDDAEWIVDRLSMLGGYSFNYAKNDEIGFALKNWVGAEQLVMDLRSSKDELLHGDIYAKHT
jgi:FkbM family methyltransferase